MVEQQLDDEEQGGGHKAEDSCSDKHSYNSP